MKITLFCFYFMPILMLSHLFFSYFILANFYFIPSLPDEENRASILFVFYIYFKQMDVHQHGGSILGAVNLCKIFRRLFEVWENVQS